MQLLTVTRLSQELKALPDEFKIKQLLKLTSELSFGKRTDWRPVWPQPLVESPPPLTKKQYAKRLFDEKNSTAPNTLFASTDVKTPGRSGVPLTTISPATDRLTFSASSTQVPAEIVSRVFSG